MDDEVNSILQNDCVAGLGSLSEGIIDLAFADPPFNIGYEYDVYDDRQERSAYLDWSRTWIAAVYRALKDNGTFWLAIGDEYAAELKVISQEIGFECRSWVVWYYTFGVNCKQKFSRSHAHLLYFVKDVASFTFHFDDPDNRIPSARQLVYADGRANPRGRLPDDTWILRPQDLSDCFTTAEDTWYFPRVAGTFKERAGFHGCQMPEQLLGRIIRSCSSETDLVLDPFAGSGTTLVVAKKLGRQYLGFDISDEYVLRARERVTSVRVGDPLEGAPEPLVSAPATHGESAAKTANSHKKSRQKQFPFNAEHLQQAKLERLTVEGLATAFAQNNQGYSLDRVIADPDLGGPLAEACRKRGLAGDERSWNLSLFRMRKAGKLKAIPTHRRTEVSWDDCDSFLFASEIALRQMLDRGCDGFDEILCDPNLAAQFDEIAKHFAPGFSSFQYRWGALKLRKETKTARVRGHVLSAARFDPSNSAFESNWSHVPDRPGVYLLSGVGEPAALYVGGTLNLRQRLGFQFGTQMQRQAWRKISPEIQVQTFVTEKSRALLLGYQSQLVRKHDPMLNYRELGITDPVDSCGPGRTKLPESADPGATGSL